MFQVSRILLSSALRPLIMLPLAAVRPLGQPSRFYFSNQAETRVFEMIKNETNEDNLELILKEIQVLGEEAKRQAIDKILQKVVEGDFSFDIVTNNKYNSYLKKFPQIWYDAYFYRIAEAVSHMATTEAIENQKEKKAVVKEINDSYAQCFEAVKNMDPESAPLKQIQLYKNFAYYHIAFLKQVVDSGKQKLCLTKGKDFYKGTLGKIMIQVKKNQEKETKLTQDVSLEKAEKEEALKAIRHRKFALYEDFGQCLIHMIEVEQQLAELEQSKLQKREEEKEEEEEEYEEFQYPISSLQMLSIIEKAVAQFKNTEELIHKSKVYHKLKQALLEMQQQKKIRAAQQSNQGQQFFEEAEKKLLQQMNGLFDESMGHFKTLCGECNDAEDLAEFSANLISIRMHYFNSGGIPEEDILVEMGQQLQDIVNCITEANLRRTVLQQLLADLKEELQVDLSPYVEKIPRSLRMGRRGRGGDLME